MSDIPEQDTCTCGHVADEHTSGHEECTVDGCRCVHFELADEETTHED